MAVGKLEMVVCYRVVDFRNAAGSQHKPGGARKVAADAFERAAMLESRAD
jgi:hypothetical protein